MRSTPCEMTWSGTGNLGRAHAAHAGQALHAIRQAGRVADLQERAGASGDWRTEARQRTAHSRAAP